MMTCEELQKKVDDVFRENFGYTPFRERMADIQKESIELMKWNDIKNVEEEAGDLMSTLMKLCAESGWKFEDLVLKTLTKIESRSAQYKSLGRKLKVALYGGAFDPIHKGHIQVAKFILDWSGEFDEVWLVPAYRHMYGKEMTSSEHRVRMCNLAAECDRRIKVFDYEIVNKLAGETYNFYKRLKIDKDLTEKHQFSLVLSMDNANTFHKWPNFQELENMAQMVVLPRAGVTRDINVDWYLKPPHIFLNNDSTGIIEASSTEIRNLLNSRNCEPRLKDLLDPKVLSYIRENLLYATTQNTI